MVIKITNTVKQILILILFFVVDKYSIKIGGECEDFQWNYTNLFKQINQ